MAFFFSPYPSNSTIPPSFSGCGLGLFDGTICHSSRSDNALPPPTPIVAVEFDTYPNDAIHDPSSPHVGFDVGSLVSVVYRSWEEDGSYENSHKWKGDASVSYDSGTHNLSVFLTLGSHESRTTTYSLSYIVDLRLVLPSQVSDERDHIRKY